MVIYLLWYFVLQSQSIMIGAKNIIIGRKLISHDSIQSISIEKNGILIKLSEESFKIHNCLISQQKNKLEKVLRQIKEKS